MFTLNQFFIMMYGKSKKRTPSLGALFTFYFSLPTPYLTLPPTSTFLFISFMAGMNAMLKVKIR